MGWRRLLRVPWTARRSNLSILKEINPEYLLEELMLKLKLQYFSPLLRRTNSWKKPWCWERLKAGGEGDNRGLDGWMASLTQKTWVWVNSRDWWWTGRPGVLQSMGLQSRTWISDWTELNLSTLPVYVLWLVHLTYISGNYWYAWSYYNFLNYYFFFRYFPSLVFPP